MRTQRNKKIEQFLETEHKFTGIPALNESAEASLTDYTHFEFDGASVYARQFPEFYRYTVKRIK